MIRIVWILWILCTVPHQFLFSLFKLNIINCIHSWIHLRDTREWNKIRRIILKKEKKKNLDKISKLRWIEKEYGENSIFHFFFFRHVLFRYNFIVEKLVQTYDDCTMHSIHFQSKIQKHDDHFRIILRLSSSLIVSLLLIVIVYDPALWNDDDW